MPSQHVLISGATISAFKSRSPLSQHESIHHVLIALFRIFCRSENFKLRTAKNRLRHHQQCENMGIHEFTQQSPRRLPHSLSFVQGDAAVVQAPPKAKRDGDRRRGHCYPANVRHDLHQQREPQPSRARAFESRGSARVLVRRWPARVFPEPVAHVTARVSL